MSSQIRGSRQGARGRPLKKSRNARSPASWAIAIWFDTGEIATILRWSQTVIDLADGDPTKGASFGFGSPLAMALATRGVARWWLGRRGWREDLDDAVEMARNRGGPQTHAAVVTYKYGWTIFYGVLRPDGSALRALEAAVQAAEGEKSEDALRKDTNHQVVRALSLNATRTL